MTARPISDLLPMVLPFAHSCPELIGLEAIRNAAIEFCERSHWVQQQITPVTLVANQTAYQMLPVDPTQTDVTAIIQVYLGQRLIYPSNPLDLAKMFGMDWRQLAGTPGYYTTIERQDTLLLAPTPDVGAAGSALRVTVAVRPLRTATTMDDSLVDRWGETIAYGARSRLHQIMRQPWYDINVAVQETRAFRAGVADAQIKINRGRVDQSLAVRPRRI